MSIERAEKLKELLTDKYVVVDSDVPELRRFQNWTGTVRTVNMNCRALVEFDGPADIGWYDIDPDYLKVVDRPAEKAPVKVSKPVTSEPKPTKAEGAVKTVLDTVQPLPTAKVGGTDVPAAKPKLSPLEMIRKQQAAKAAAAAPAPDPNQAELPGEALKEAVSTGEELPFLVDVPLPLTAPVSEVITTLSIETSQSIEIVLAGNTDIDHSEAVPDPLPSESISEPNDVKTPEQIDIDRNDDDLKK